MINKIDFYLCGMAIVVIVVLANFISHTQFPTVDTSLFKRHAAEMSEIIAKHQEFLTDYYSNMPLTIAEVQEVKSEIVKFGKQEQISIKNIKRLESKLSLIEAKISEAHSKIK